MERTQRRGLFARLVGDSPPSRALPHPPVTRSWTRRTYAPLHDLSARCAAQAQARAERAAADRKEYLPDGIPDGTLAIARQNFFSPASPRI